MAFITQINPWIIDACTGTLIVIVLVMDWESDEGSATAIQQACPETSTVLRSLFDVRSGPHAAMSGSLFDATSSAALHPCNANSALREECPERWRA